MDTKLGTPNRKILVLPLVLGRSRETLPYLALGMLTAYLRQCKLNGLLKPYRIGKLFPAGYKGRSLETLYKKVSSEHDPVCLFSSYVWNHDLNIEAAKHIRSISPGALIIFGGPHVPKYAGESEEFLLKHNFIDIVVLGEGETACADILLALAGSGRSELGKLRDVAGIVFSDIGIVTRTVSRQRIGNVCDLPSPYLTGEFEPWFSGFSVTVLETNRGCPYGCTYCDWGSATLAKVTKFAPERVVAEIEYLAQKKSQTIFIADANFGMLEQDIEIARALVQIKATYGYPQRVMTNFAKNGGRRLMSVIKIMHDGGLLPTGMIALQTTDPAVLKVIARDNIKTESYEKMMSYFNDEKIPMASDLMIGLPGQTVDSFANDLQFCFDWKVAAGANYTSMMPNAPMAEKSYVAEHMIVTDEDNMIQSTASFTADDMNYMKELYTVYLFHVKFGVLKYVLYYLQIEHDIPAITLLRRWLDHCIEGDSALPISRRVCKEILRDSQHRDWAVLNWSSNADFLFENIDNYYTELLDFVERDFGVELRESEYRTLIAAQQAVMPRVGRQYPYTLSLDHDMVSYVQQIKTVASVRRLNGDLTRLSEFSAGTLSVRPDTEAFESTYFQKIVTHAEAWELPSSLRFY